MKRINQYFCSGCVAFTVIITIITIMHLINHQVTINVVSVASLLFLILVIQAVLYIMENVHIKPPITHMALELFIIMIITFSIGIPMKVIEIVSLAAVIETILIIATAYAIASLSIYRDSKNDEEDINKRLQEK